MDLPDQALSVMRKPHKASLSRRTNDWLPSGATLPASSHLVPRVPQLTRAHWSPLLRAGPAKTVEFDFDLGADTAMSVATEMVNELSLSHEDARAIATAIGDEIRQLTGKRERHCPRPCRQTNANADSLPVRLVLVPILSPDKSRLCLNLRSGRVPA